MSFGLIELALVFGITLAIGIWELLSIRRQLRRDRSPTEINKPTIPTPSETVAD